MRVVFIAVVLFFIILVCGVFKVVYDNNQARGKCEELNGIPINDRGEIFCVKKESIINLESEK